MTHPILASARSGYGGRGYSIPGRLTPDGKRDVYPSITTVLGVVAKDGLHQWIADQTAAFAVANLGYLQGIEDEKGYGFLRWYWSGPPGEVGSKLRLHHEAVRDDAAELGTNVHETVEALFDGGDAPEPVGEETDEIMAQFMEWLGQHDVIQHASEFTVVDDEERYAGTGDADWEICCLHEGPACFGQSPGEYARVLVDLKTSRHTWDEHGFQLAALAGAPTRMVLTTAETPGARPHDKTEDGKKSRTWWTEEPNPVYDRMALLHMRPFDLDNQGEVIESFCKVVDMTQDIDVYYDGFIAARALIEVKKIIKDRKKFRATETEH